MLIVIRCVSQQDSRAATTTRVRLVLAAARGTLRGAREALLEDVDRRLATAPREQCLRHLRLAVRPPRYRQAATPTRLGHRRAPSTAAAAPPAPPLPLPPPAAPTPAAAASAPAAAAAAAAARGRTRALPAGELHGEVRLGDGADRRRATRRRALRRGRHSRSGTTRLHTRGCHSKPSRQTTAASTCSTSCRRNRQRPMPPPPPTRPRRPPRPASVVAPAPAHGRASRSPRSA